MFREPQLVEVGPAVTEITRHRGVAGWLVHAMGARHIVLRTKETTVGKRRDGRQRLGWGYRTSSGELGGDDVAESSWRLPMASVYDGRPDVPATWTAGGR